MRIFDFSELLYVTGTPTIITAAQIKCCLRCCTPSEALLQLQGFLDGHCLESGLKAPQELHLCAAVYSATLCKRGSNLLLTRFPTKPFD